jgi:hypothetical protein
MTMQLTTGNAGADSAPFKGWFMGDLNRWAPGNDVAAFGLRQSSMVEMKWGVHRAGETRPEWAPCSNKSSLSVLVRGQFLGRFRKPNDPDTVVERRLVREGDYVVWGTDLEHTWVAEEDSVIFTIRWVEQP